jgi:ArsR family transcriptional regulator
MNDLTSLFKVLSDETRLRILHLLYHQDLCVCELVEILQLSQPKISKHIAKLRQIDLVSTTRKEQYIYYSLNRDKNQYLDILQPIFKQKHDLFQLDINQLNQIENFVCNRSDSK